MDTPLAGKTILLGVTGSIAAYKSLQIVRDLTEAGATVQVVLTVAARRFVPERTLQIFSGRPVFTHLFDSRNDVAHLSLAHAADLILVAPATAHFIAKMAMGLADDLLGNLLLCARAPIFVAPAKDLGMWAHPAVQYNTDLLRARGVTIIDPATGPLASGAVGEGRLADEAAICQALVSHFSPRLAGETVLVTAGPTHEPIDPVRFLSNRSSGKMGYAIASVARQWGARVILVSGPTALPCPVGVTRIDVQTGEEMKRVVDARFSDATIVVMAAAVSDYRPQNPAAGKIKKTFETRTLVLEPVGDILKQLPAERQGKVVVGFAAETENVVENAKKKRRDKRLDLIVANDVTAVGAGFGVDTNIAFLIDRSDRVTALPKMTKIDLAGHILAAAQQIRTT